MLNEHGKVVGIAALTANLAISAKEIADVREREDWEIRQMERPPDQFRGGSPTPDLHER